MLAATLCLLNARGWHHRCVSPVMQEGSADAEMMRMLARRMAEQRTAVEPEPAHLLVMDAMVPRQTMHLESAPSAFVERLRALRDASESAAPIVMVGKHRWLHSRGVEVSVSAATSNGDVVLRAGRLCELVSVESGDGTWSDDLRAVDVSSSAWDGPRDARVRWLACDTPGEATLLSDAQRSDNLRAVVDEWVDKVRRSRRERFRGQLDIILDSLGPMPPSAKVSERCMWVAALLAQTYELWKLRH